MIKLSKWVTLVLVGIYVAMNTLGALTMTVIRTTGSVPASAPAAQASYFLNLPWGVIVLMWLALCVYVAALALIGFGRPGATRTLGAAVAIDLGRWLWARTATAYAAAISPAEQAMEALAFVLLITIVVLMIVERRRDALT
jgi:hypothetical protein